MIFIKRFFWYFTMIANLSYSFGAESPSESQSLSSYSNLLLTRSAEQIIPLARAIYQQRHILVPVSLAYILLSSLPAANAFESTSPSYPGIDCTTMKPTMVLCEYGYSGGYRLHDICQYGCESYPGSLDNLASGMVNLCCDYYHYFFDYY